MSDINYDTFYIGGASVHLSTKRVITPINASTEQSLGQVPEGAEADIDAAVAGTCNVHCGQMAGTSDTTPAQRWHDAGGHANIRPADERQRHGRAHRSDTRVLGPTRAQRIQALQAEAKDLEDEILRIVGQLAPELLDLLGVGPITAAQVLVSWSHPGRFRSEAAFASFAGVAPIPASSGLTSRHRINRGGDRQLNRALHTITLIRSRLDPATKTCLARRALRGETIALRPARARRLAGELARVHLVDEHEPGRFRLHDLLRSYAREQAHSEEPKANRQAATRNNDFFVHTALAADRHISPYRVPIPGDSTAPDAVEREFEDRPDAVRWCEVEYDNLISLVPFAYELGFDIQAWKLAWAVSPVFNQRGRWHDRIAVLSHGITAAERLGDLHAQARCRSNLGYAFTQSGQHPRAIEHYHHALQLYRTLDNPAGEAAVLNGLAWSYAQLDRHSDALDHATPALRLAEEVGNTISQANVLTTLSYAYAGLSRHDTSLTCGLDALRLHRAMRNRAGEANILRNLSWTYVHLQRHAEALDCARHALTIYQERGNQHGEANSLLALAHNHRAIGKQDQAHREQQHAEELLKAF
jgi:tetratricopeptide (TPR) repeat protein